MSDNGPIQAKLDEWLKDHEEIKGMLQVADDAFDTLSKINSWVETAIGVLKMIGVLGGEGPNPFQQLYDALDARMKQILGAIRTHDLDEHINRIEELLNKAVSAAESANEFVKEGRSDVSAMEDEEAASREAVNGLTDMSSMKWKHIPFPELADKEIPTPTEGGNVWDYRWALPAALKAIASRLAVLDAIDRDHRKTGRYRDQIQKYAVALLNIHRKITEGIKPSLFVSLRRRDNPAESRVFTDEIVSMPVRLDLLTVPIRCGAVDMWSASTKISDWNGMEVLKHSDVFKHYDELKRNRRTDIEQAAIDVLNKYFELFASETKKRWLATYDAVGLDSLARIVTNLKLLARADEVPKSLREMAGAFEARHFPPAPGGARVSLRNLLSWVGTGETNSLSQLQNAALKEKLFSYVPEVMNTTLKRENLAIG